MTIKETPYRQVLFSPVFTVTRPGKPKICIMLLISSNCRPSPSPSPLSFSRLLILLPNQSLFPVPYYVLHQGSADFTLSHGTLQSLPQGFSIFLVGWFPRPQWKSWRTISQRWLMAVVSHGLMTISLLFSSVSPMISVSRQKRDAMCSMWEPTLLHLCLPSPSLQGKRTTWVPGNSVCTDRHRSCWLICWTWVYIHSWDCSDAPLRLLQGTRFRVGASWPPVFWDSMHRCLCLIIPDFDKDSTGIWSSG